MASKLETKKSHPFEKAKKHADKKRARVDEDAHDSAQLDDKSKRPKKAHKSALDTSKPGVEAKKTGVIPAVSTLPVERKKVSDSTNPVKKKKKNKSQKVLNPITGKWAKDAKPKAPIEQRMSEMTSLMNKTSEQTSGKELAKYTNSDELRPLASAITDVKEDKSKKNKKHSTLSMLPDVEAVSGDEITDAKSSIQAIGSSANPAATSVLPVAAVTQFMNDLENVFMQFKMRYTSELAGAVVVESKVASPVAKEAYPAVQEKLPTKLIKTESMVSKKGSDADSGSDESSDDSSTDDKLDDSHSSNTLVDSY